MNKTIFMSILFAAFLSTNVADAHLHISTQLAGQKLDITTYGDVQTFQGGSNLLSNPDGSPVIFTLSDLAANGPFAGYLAGAAPTLTTDFYGQDNADTNPLHGADVIYELSSVAVVSGSAGNVIGYEIPAGDAPYQNAFSNGATFADRTLDYGLRNHYHGVTLYSLLAGTYDVTISATDKNGLFQPSDPVTIRINAIPEPIAIYAIPLLLLTRRRTTRAIK